MESKELRLGNRVTIDNKMAWPQIKDVPLTVIGIEYKDDRHFINSKGSVRLEDSERSTYAQFDEFIKPIPLNEEWLLRFGFEKKAPYTQYGNGQDWQPPIPKTDYQDYVLTGTNDVYVRYGTFYWLDKENNIIKDEPEGRMQIVSNYYPVPQFVHQLQNLFFCLCGEELALTSLQQPLKE